MNNIKTRIKNQGLIDETHARIARAAVSLFIKKGFHQTSIREIADASRMSMGLLYRYISSKDDVLSLAYEQIHKENLEGISSAKMEKSRNPREKLKKSMENMLKLVERDRKKYLFVYTESKFLSPNALKPVLEKENIVIEHFRKIIEEGIKSGQFDIQHAPLAASIISYILMIGPLRGWSFRKKYPPDFSIRYLINFCLRAISRGDGNKKSRRRKSKAEP
jgi:AcrR family transcriptional regulator